MAIHHVGDDEARRLVEGKRQGFTPHPPVYLDHENRHTVKGPVCVVCWGRYEEVAPSPCTGRP